MDEFLFILLYCVFKLNHNLELNQANIKRFEHENDRKMKYSSTKICTQWNLDSVELRCLEIIMKMWSDW